MQLRDKQRIALLAAFAIALHALERMIPAPLPWFKFGLANIITLLALLLYGFNTAMMITMVRVFAGSLLTGTFLGPAFALSLAGGIAGTLAMAALYKTMPRAFGPLGISLAGALAHNLAQLAAAHLLFIRNLDAILLVSPFILLIGVLTGAANGLFAVFLMMRLKNAGLSIQNTPCPKCR
jgi:heptaprenyl diphosphate synthase